jgi:putative endonuclease
MASRRNGTLYVGVTNNIALRAHQHRTGAGGGFTSKYRVTLLVWYEFHSDINEAIIREKRIKKWERRWKLELIERNNPEWADLYKLLNGAEPPRGAPRLGPRLRGDDTKAAGSVPRPSIGQNKKYRCAIGSRSAGSHTRSSPSALTS